MYTLLFADNAMLSIYAFVPFVNHCISKPCKNDYCKYLQVFVSLIHSTIIIAKNLIKILIILSLNLVHRDIVT